MQWRKLLCIGRPMVLSASIFSVLPVLADEPAKPKAEPAAAEAPAGNAAVKPKSIAEKTQKGLAYIVNQQQASGGWGQGGGWRTATQGGRVEGAEAQDTADVGNTAIAMLALIRGGHTPKEGEYAKNLAKGVEFIAAKINKVEKDSPFVTDVLGT